MQQQNRNVLGKGLGSLIPHASSRSGFWGSPMTPADGDERILQVGVGLIESNPWQPRSRFDDEKLQELAQSIREHGIIQPLVVTQAPAGRYQLIAGERRLKAARSIGLSTVPVIVRKAEEQKKLELSLIENLQRHDLNPLEEAVSYRKLMDEFSLTQEEVAVRVGKSRSSIANFVRLLNLPQDILAAVSEEKITFSHAKAILSYETEAEQRAAFKKITEQGLTVKEASKRPQRLPRTAGGADPVLRGWEERLSQRLGFRAAIHTQGARGGVIEIEFSSEEDLKTLLDALLGGGATAAGIE